MNKNSVGIADVIKQEVDGAVSILDKSSLSEEDRTAVIDIIKSMAYQWCRSNASACTLNHMLKMKGMSESEICIESINHPLQLEMIAKTYPFV